MQIYSSDLASTSRKVMKCDRDGCCESTYFMSLMTPAAAESCENVTWTWQKKIFITQIITSPPHLEQQERSLFCCFTSAFVVKKAGTNEIFHSRIFGKSPSVSWCFRGEPTVAPVRSLHAWTVEVSLTAGRDVIWPSGSMFSCLLFGSLSCCCGDKKMTPGGVESS